MTTESGRPSSGEVRYRVLSVRMIAAWSVVIVLVGVGVAVWLLLAYTGGDAEANRVQLDAIRTAGTIVVGTGGAAALLLAARRQRSTEIALRQTDREQVTDLYAKAVEQLGSEKAPVRLGGLYALERLAQDNPSQRQTIVNVLCAYLRMPYTLPGEPPADDAEDTLITAHRERVQEREVRVTAQRILTHHLRPGDNPDPVETFWADIGLDLTGATLINLNLSHCATRNAQFTQATLTGATTFDQATFTHNAYFLGATFTDNASFIGATFTRNTDFSGATFSSNTAFSRATLPSTRRAAFSTPSPWTDFAKARFARGVPPEVAEFVTPPPPAEGGNPLSTG